MRWAKSPSTAAMPVGVDDSPGGNLMSVLRATGMAFPDAMHHAVATLGGEALRGQFMAYLKGKHTGLAVMRLLDRVAGADPRAANAWLGVALSTGRMLPWDGPVGMGYHFERYAWLTSLPTDVTLAGDLNLSGLSIADIPAGVAVKGGVNLYRCVCLSRLPEDFRVTKDLWMGKCVSLATLPEGLGVGGELNLNGCTSWDGRFPERFYVGGHIYLPDGRMVTMRDVLGIDV